MRPKPDLDQLGAFCLILILGGMIAAIIKWPELAEVLDQFIVAFSAALFGYYLTRKSS